MDTLIISLAGAVGFLLGIMVGFVLAIVIVRRLIEKGLNAMDGKVTTIDKTGGASQEGGAAAVYVDPIRSRT